MLSNVVKSVHNNCETNIKIRNKAVKIMSETITEKYDISKNIMHYINLMNSDKI